MPDQVTIQGRVPRIQQVTNLFDEPVWRIYGLKPMPPGYAQLTAVLDHGGRWRELGEVGAGSLIDWPDRASAEAFIAAHRDQPGAPSLVLGVRERFRCPTCDGKGMRHVQGVCFRPCCTCDGTGTIPRDVADQPGQIAALPLPDGTGGWRDIETAPKDGTKVALLCPGTFGAVVGYWTDDKHVLEPRPYWTNHLEHLAGRAATRHNQPTHWMPLPAPPIDPGKIVITPALDVHTEQNRKERG